MRTTLLAMTMLSCQPSNQPAEKEALETTQANTLSSDSCATNYDCRANQPGVVPYTGQVCSRGACTDCTGNEQCSANQRGGEVTCLNGRCVDYQLASGRACPNGNFDCDNGLLCRSPICVPCSIWGFEGDFAIADSCRDALGGRNYCDYAITGHCIVSPSCTTAKDCPGAHDVCAQGSCVPDCRGCPAGESCLLGCLNDETCADDGTCRPKAQ